MKLLEFFLKRKILIGLLVVLILMIGSYAAVKLDKELMPAIDMDGAYVEMLAGEMASADVERSITDPIEKQLLAMDGVTDVESTTGIGRSSLQVTFDRGKGDALYPKVESSVNAAAADMPAVEHIETGRYGSNQSYEFYMDVSGGSMEEMTAFAKDVLEPRLEDLAEVRDVSLSGIEEHKAVIAFDEQKLISHALDAQQAVQAVQTANSEATLGRFSNDEDSPSLRWDTTYTDIQDIENTEIATADGVIHLKDVAEVSLKPVQDGAFVWKNGSKDFIFVQVGRTDSVSQIEMADAVRAEIKEIEDAGLVNGFELHEMVAQADYVQESIDGVSNNILIGGIIAIAVLLLFLRNIRATAIIALSIPTSILLTFTAMWLFDYSFNMLTLIGLGLGIGMMVDSSIVILESIYRKKEAGLSNRQSVLQGTKEVATAVFASMLTTIVVFLPIGLLGGEIAQFMIMLSLVVVFTLTSSVLVSFTLIPALSERFLKFGKKQATQKDGKMLQLYQRILAWTVRKKRYSLSVIGLFFVLFAASLFLVTKLPMTIMPDVFNRYSELMVETETGISPEEKETLVQQIDNKLQEIDDVETNYVMDNGDMLYAIINMTKGEDITREQKDINEDIMASLRSLEDKTPLTSVQNAMTGGGGYPVQVHIAGEDFSELNGLTEQFITDLKKIEGIVGVTHSMENASPEQVVELNKEKIEDAGLSQGQIKQYIEQAFWDIPVGEMVTEDETIPLSAAWSDETLSQKQLLEKKIPTTQGEQELSSFVALRTVETPNEISHTNGERYVSVSADIEGKDLGTINREVQKLIDDYELPGGYSISTAGDLEQQQELMMDMAVIFLLAIFLVYLVMAVQFNHLAHPLIVMSIIPMTVVGVIVGLFLTQRELSIMSGMGIVMLIGIVLNNAILLIDRTNQLRKNGANVDAALVEAGKNRIRPIFLTTLTTAGGMLPLAFASGTSGNYQAPMATVIISGLLFATFITLFLIPAVYRLFTRNKKKQIPEQESVISTGEEAI
ncbi:MMPL family transporter [Sediminibacillus dalangtanensis]|uniref:MMPL family transporter n=1 Tax=Sediminibacillus dalangtanensis TaxID=2729421 RepID=A0ABX7VPA2_9BACI|nr:efflux RND transporter permease subunit [Sediminibacillus dalangtanensis]QTM98298.1 MMPL family transporter [Sediminibacillus dalangtanensis]